MFKSIKAYLIRCIFQKHVCVHRRPSFDFLGIEAAKNNCTRAFSLHITIHCKQNNEETAVCQKKTRQPQQLKGM